MGGSVRHDLRVLVVQALFENDFRKTLGEKTQVWDSFSRIAVENIPSVNDHSFARTIIDGVLSKQKEIDSIIEKVATDWPLEKIAIVDRNILRMGIFEVLFGKSFDVPGKVAINEAIELGKAFSGEASGKFINGVLGTVYRESGRTEEQDLRKKSKESVGALIYRIENGIPYFAFVLDIFNKWTLSKGGLKEGEVEDVGLHRAIKEELGISIELEKLIGENSYVTHPPEGPLRNKVKYYKVRTTDKELKLKECEGLQEARWFLSGEIDGLPMYKDIRDMIEENIRSVIGEQSIKV